MWNLKVNVHKTKVKILEKGRIYTLVDIYFDDTKLELVESFKYLGLISIQFQNIYLANKYKELHKIT